MQAGALQQLPPQNNCFIHYIQVLQGATQSCSTRCYMGCSELNDEQSLEQQPDLDDQHASVFERGKTVSDQSDLAACILQLHSDMLCIQKSTHTTE